MRIDQLRRHGGACALMAVMLMAGCERSEPAVVPPAPQVSVLTLAPSRLELTDDLPGRVAALRVAEIRPQVSGIVLHRSFEQGSEVRAGQPLFQIDPAPFKAEVDIAAAALQRATVGLERARVQVARLQPLVKSDAVSRQVYDNAVFQHDQAVAEVAQARATLARRTLDLKFATVEAPIPGRVDQALVTEGALVGGSDGNPMARVQQIDQVYVDVRQPASSLASLRKALALRQAEAGDGLPVAILRDDGKPYDTTGRVLFSGISVDPGTGDVLLRILVDNPQRDLLPGMFVRARVPRTSYADALTLPQQAVVRVGGQPQVWTLDGNDQASLKPVELGELVDRCYRVGAGLEAGQKIVVEGMDRLSEGVPVAARDWPVSKPTATTMR
ncbi:efflux transporter periplasmic adaptor subunit (plasmid) [Azospirillum humicireducens]|uniref:Efflux transporter periplasmic adaptor subunit n=1 Tax=Azospirillum humicireducens TaxID=1226968 RepID=A0A2R4VU43_9PROT|nr:efflux RND transporter periplasmic adaptor subunit [Azospirillum humicireducens]AWB07947.1 efflux transporter periplasmic adaptor subunit [Azospirillum humicireducens]